jgi:hypothetical protein
MIVRAIGEHNKFFIGDLNFFIRWLIFNIIVEYWSCVTCPCNRRSKLGGKLTSNKPDRLDVTKKIFKFIK